MPPDDDFEVPWATMRGPLSTCPVCHHVLPAHERGEAPDRVYICGCHLLWRHHPLAPTVWQLASHDKVVT